MNDQPVDAATVWGEPARTNFPEYTVSELSLALKRSIEEGFSHVRVRGEISGFKRHSSGHCYLALKDSDASVRRVAAATMTDRSMRAKSRWRPVEAGKAVAIVYRTTHNVRCHRVRWLLPHRLPTEGHSTPTPTPTPTPSHLGAGLPFQDVQGWTRGTWVRRRAWTWHAVKLACANRSSHSASHW